MLKEENTVPPEYSTSPLHRTTTMTSAGTSRRVLRKNRTIDSSFSKNIPSTLIHHHNHHDDDISTTHDDDNNHDHDHDHDQIHLQRYHNQPYYRRGHLKRQESMPNSTSKRNLMHHSVQQHNNEEEETKHESNSQMKSNGYRPTFGKQFFKENNTTTTENNTNNNNTGNNHHTNKRSSSLRHVLEAGKYINVVTPVHWGPARDAIIQKTLQSKSILPAPMEDIRNYYGEDVAFYFAWMGQLTQWLIVLGTMGLLTQLFRYVRNDTIDEDEYTPFYGLFTFVWGVLFLRFWRRHEHRLAYRWGTYSLTLYDKQKALTMRPEFTGTLRISPITGEYEMHYPAHKRRMQYIVSAVITCVMLSIAFCMMILSLNMQGYIHPERNPERWNANNQHPFHYPTFAALSDKEQLFDKLHPWKSFIPTIVHVAMIFTLNSIYRVTAELLTEWENHETEAEYRNSLILKRFLFEAFDCYVALFYLAFYERDVDRLHMELKTVFNIDTFRRLASECFLPFLIQKVHKWTGATSIKVDKASRNDRVKKEMNSSDKHHGNIDSPSYVGTVSTTVSSSSSSSTTADRNSTDGGDVPSSSHKPRNSKGQPSLEELADEADKDEYVSCCPSSRVL